MTRSNQHRAVTAIQAQPLAENLRPARGSIAIVPEPDERYADAVLAGGGVLADNHDEARGIIWTAHDAGRLERFLEAHPLVAWVQLPLAGSTHTRR